MHLMCYKYVCSIITAMAEAVFLDINFEVYILWNVSSVLFLYVSLSNKIV